MDRVRHPAPDRGRAARSGDRLPWLLQEGLPDRGSDKHSDCGGAAGGPAVPAAATALPASFAPTDFRTSTPRRAAALVTIGGYAKDERNRWTERPREEPDAVNAGHEPERDPEQEQVGWTPC